MKNLIHCTLFFFAFLLSAPQIAFAVIAPKAAPPVSVFDLPEEEYLELSNDQLVEKMGRKLKWKEKFAIKMIKKNAKKIAKIKGEEVDAKTDGMAIAGFVLGVLGILRWGFILGVLGIIFSAIALGRIKRDPDKKGRGLAMAGLITGIIAVAVWVLIFGLALIVV